MLPRILHEKFALGDAGGAECIRLNDVCPSFQKPAMDVTDHLWLSKRKNVTVIQQILRGVFETLPADVSFCHAVSANRRAHRSINDGDSALEDLLKRMLPGYSHLSPSRFPCICDDSVRCPQSQLRFLASTHE